MTDPFQEKLLMALKEDIASRDAVPAAAPRSHRRRRLLGMGLATAALAGVAAVGVPMLGETPAYAVDREPDGSIKIEIYPEEITPAELENFEHRLEFFGVNAEVDWLNNGEACAQPRGVEVKPPAVDDPTPPYWPAPLFQTEPGETVEDPSIWRIRPQYLQPGQTLVWAVQPVIGPDWSIIGGQISVIEGPVSPCVIVPGETLGDPRLGN